MDGLLRIAVNNCQFLRAKKGVQADEAAEGLPSCVLAEAQKMSERIFYGWPWDTLGEEALGLSSKEALDRVTSEFIPSLLRQVCQSRTATGFVLGVSCPYFAALTVMFTMSCNSFREFGQETRFPSSAGEASSEAPATAPFGSDVFA